MKPTVRIALTTALTLLAAVPLQAEVVRSDFVSASIAAANAPVADNVERYYLTIGNRLIWLGQDNSAGLMVADRLAHADLDGFAEGPARAAEIRAALATQTTPAGKLATDKMISKAWTRYVRAMGAPLKDVIYGDQRVTPTPKTPERILMEAAGARSKAVYVSAEGAGNPMYERMRNAAIASYVDKGTPVPARVLTNMARLRELPQSGRFVLVDAASQQLQMYENGNLVDSMKVVVGKPQYATPMIASVIYYAALNPYWHVPDHLVREKIAPAAAKGGDTYLKRQGYEVVSEWTDTARVVPASEVDWKGAAAGTTEVKVRQLPSSFNAMGKIKFYFANGEGIYLHDTPQKEYFLKSKRDLSNGCVRLQDAPRLAKFLMGAMPTTDDKAPEHIVKLDQGVPVFVTYLSVAEKGGELSFLDDIYGRDGAATTLN